MIKLNSNVLSTTTGQTHKWTFTHAHLMSILGTSLCKMKLDRIPNLTRAYTIPLRI